MKESVPCFKTSRATAPCDTHPCVPASQEVRKGKAREALRSFYQARKPPRSSKLTSPRGPLTNSGSCGHRHSAGRDRGEGSGSQSDSVARIDLELILIHCLGLTTLLPKQDQSSVHEKGQGPQMATWCIKVFVMDGEQICLENASYSFPPMGI